jgi:hypothetical protein
VTDSLIATFGEALAPALKKMRGNDPGRFQVNLDDLTRDDVSRTYDRLGSSPYMVAATDEADLTNFSLLLGAKILQSDFNMEEREKISNLRDYFMLGMARMHIGGDEGLTYHSTIMFHQEASISAFKWNSFPKRDFMMNKRKMEIYDRYTHQAYENTIEQERKGGMAEFHVPEPIYRDLTTQEIVEYSTYLVVRGDVEQYLRHPGSSVQKYQEILDNGGSFNVLDLRETWWEEQDFANKPN